ncbi:MAG TPA: sigma-70 family RNA polymerase sigma factor [Candidatus Limnocylindria bacterium]|nr:sigma-70 family RNA polymerase sigma factor [Candidatus Limnocylindria bacterium]
MSSWPARMGVRTGARPSFAAIAEEHLDAVYRYLLLMTRDRTAAEDLTGETFEKAFRSWRRFDPRRAAPRTWLCQIARNAALDHFRSEERRRRRETTYAADAPESEEPRLEGLSTPLEMALGELSAGEREVVALRVLLELDVRTAARVLGISPTACSTRLSRALQKLEEKVRDHGR